MADSHKSDNDSDEEKAVMKDNTRVLTPREYSKLKEHLTPSYIAICDVLLHSGMRISEFRRFCEHREWYDRRRRCIDMIALKKKTVHKSRSINLTSSGVVAVDHLFKMLDDNLQIPSRQAMTGVLQRAAVEAKLPDGDKGICPKMFRKTWVSWLMNTFPALMFKIASNMGHTLAVMENNYSNLTFADDDAEDIAKFVKGWGGTK